MATYYIDSAAGSDANAGTSEGAPLATIARAATLCGMTGSHQILLKRGGTFIESVYFYHPFTGTAGNRAKFGAYGPETDPRPIWTASSLTTNPYNLRIGNTTTQVSYLDIEDIDFIGQAVPSAPHSYCINVNNSQPGPATSVRVRRCIFRGTGSAGLSTYRGSGAAVAPSINGEFTDNVIHSIGCDGMGASGWSTYDDLGTYLVARNHVYDVAQDGQNAGDCMEFGGYALVGLVVRDNTFDMRGNNSKQCMIINHANSDATAGRVLIEGNTMLRDQWGGPTSDVAYSVTSVLYVRNPNAIIRRNWLDGGEYGLIIAGGATGQKIESNIIANNAKGISVGTGAADVVGNTLYGSRQSPNGMLGIAIDKNANNTATVRNNLILSSDFGISCTGAGNNNNNAFHGVTTSYRLSANGTSDVTADPLVDSVYRPGPSSPLRGAGVHPGYARDNNGMQRRKPPTIGALEVFRRKA